MTAAQEYYEEFRPALSEMADAIHLTPLSPHDRAGLAMMVAAHVFGTACAALEEARGIASGGPVGPDPEIAREVADVLVALLRQRGRDA